MVAYSEAEVMLSSKLYLSMDYFLEEYINTAFTRTGGWLQTLRTANANELLLTQQLETVK